MLSIRATTITVAGVVSMLALGACSKAEDARPADSPAAATPVTSEAPKPLEIGDIDMGRHIGPDQKITDKTDDFAPGDTIYAAVDTKNAGSGKLTARWTSEAGTTVKTDSMTVSPTADATTAFWMVAPATTGKYTVHILLNDIEAKTKEITVKR